MGLWEMLKGEQPGLITSIKNFDNLGQFGEFVVEFALTNDNLKGEFVVLKNIYLPIKGKTTEVDLLLIHEKGLFVFEVKNYSGFIFGDLEQLKWTQRLQNGKRYSFYNPIRQNKTHIQALAEYLGLQEEDFFSYIVFSERCTLKKVPENQERMAILRRVHLLKHLRKYLKKATTIYTKEEIESLAQKLQAVINISEEEKQKHIDDVKTKCPYCGSDLIERKGKFGTFAGCSTYPKCRYTGPVKK